MIFERLRVCINLHIYTSAHLPINLMFTRQEASRIRQEFWTTFGKYMRPITAAEGIRVNWVNYHTGLKDVYFRMDAGKNFASVCISIEQSDADVRELYFDQFSEFRTLLQITLNEEWVWEKECNLPGGAVVSRIGKQLEGVSVFNKNDWPEIIAFLKPRIIALDSFWENARYSFDALR